jgi:CheY-like chemotaxis protein
MKNSPLRILLTDDDLGDRIVFAEIFEEMELETTVQLLKNGVELMDYLNKKDVLFPDLLFLDLNMPNKNGMTCLKEIRSNEKFKDISIAIYSTSASEKDIEESFQLGANIYITKPSDFGILKQVLAKAISVTHQYNDTSFNRENFVLKI